MCSKMWKNGKLNTMNNLENMNSCLSELKRFGCVGVKAEFEAEGTRDNELIWLSTITRTNNLPMTLKIGGCEAMRDLYAVKQFGVEKVVAPMIESRYALEKYIHSIKKVFPSKDRQFLFNVETISGFNCFSSMFELTDNEDYIDGVVFGRVDFNGSLGKQRDAINTAETTNYVNAIGKIISNTDMFLVVGGGIDNEAYPQLCAMPHITHFETRKIIFDASIVKSVDQSQFNYMIDLCAKFELSWLEYKHESYSFIADEDISRIEMLRKRVDD